ncbi:uncharacterized protein LOC114290746 [Camellia sinensis]|uniref:uncharacterized protein LOC114290746 n=1 Tax=Camellia sinensis TaxID=4442 RepID=UPI0010367F5A|nr:uncharacterized protein LOC114290746 [Camellia sinensis]
MEVWNKAAIAKHVWYLFSGGEYSMWCQCVKSYLLKGKSFWGIKVPSDASWYDNWHPFGSLLLRYGPRILYDTNLRDSSKEWIAATPPSLKPSLDSPDIPVWSLTADGSFSIHSAWECWRDKGPKVTWSNLIWGPPVIPRVSFIVWLAIHERLNIGDRLQIFGLLTSPSFSIHSAWECWRDKGPKVTWSNLIWGPPVIPRVSFIVWLAIHERLNTGDRLQIFGLLTSPSCPLCCAPEENHSHLFFGCLYSLSKLNVFPTGLLCPGWNLLSLLLNPSMVNL